MMDANRQEEIFREDVRINYSRCLNSKEAARYLRCSAARLDIWRSEKQGPPFHRIGRSVVYSRRDLDA